MENKKLLIKPDIVILASLLDIVLGTFGFIVGLLLLPNLPAIQNGLYFINHMGYADNFMSSMMYLMINGLLIVSIPLIISGIGLYFGYTWSVYLHIISWIPVLLMFPIGTVIGILAIWIVLTQNVKDYFHNN